MKLQRLEALAIAARREGCLDRCNVDLAHELADVLLLSRESAVSRDATGEQHRVAQTFRQRQRIELIVRQPDERFAEALQVIALALALALAERFFGHER